MKILFVCTGNTCRSPMAEGIMKAIIQKRGADIKVDSAGIAAGNGFPPSENAVAALAELGIDIHDKKSKLLTNDMIEESDLILVMTSRHKQFLSQTAPGRIFTVGEYAGTGEEISDPYGGSPDVYKKTAQQLYTALERVFDIVSSKG